MCDKGEPGVYIRCPYCSILSLCVGRTDESCDHRWWFLLTMCHVQHTWCCDRPQGPDLLHSSFTRAWGTHSFVLQLGSLCISFTVSLKTEMRASLMAPVLVVFSFAVSSNLFSRWFYHKYYELYYFGLRRLRSCLGGWCFFLFDTQSSNRRSAGTGMSLYIILYYIMTCHE